MDNARRTFDVVVLGGGPAGMAAAITAAESGCSVALIEATPWPGGPVWRPTSGKTISKTARSWFQRLSRSGCRIYVRTSAFALSEPRVLLTEHEDGVREFGLKQLVLAVGSRELFIPFPGWTLPNVLGAGGMQLLGKTGWPVAGKRIIVAGSGPLLIAVASHLKQQGARVTDIVEQVSAGRLARFACSLPRLAPGKLWQAMCFQTHLFGVRFRPGCWPVAAHGDASLTGVSLTNGSKTWTRECDYLACAFGLVPELHWPNAIGCQIDEDAVKVDQWQQTSVPGVFSAGETTGISGVDGALIEGQIAGYAAAGRMESAKQLFPQRSRAQRFARALRDTFQLRSELKSITTPDTIVCRCEDVDLGEIQKHDTLRSAKLQTRCGMGPCQGRVCCSAIRYLTGLQNGSVRPPIVPTSVGSLKGPVRQPPQ